MSHIVLVTSIMFVLAAPEQAPPSSHDQRAFEAARAEAGDDPAKLIKLSFWCEGHGLRAERLAVLEQAVRAAPDNASARGLLNQVRFQGRWEKPEAVPKQIQDDAALTAKLAEYNARRDRLDEKERGFQADRHKRRPLAGPLSPLHRAAYRHDRLEAERHHLAFEHAQLALWCEKNDLKPEAEAHFTTALHLNPHDEGAWRHLGYVKHQGRWMTQAQIAAVRHEELVQKHADRHWGEFFRKRLAELRVPRRREQAEKELAKVSDPRAVPTIVRELRPSNVAGQRMALRVLSQIDAPSSSKQLAAMAVYEPAAAVRDEAAQALKGREPRDWAGGLVGLVRAPMTYQVQPVTGPGSRGALVIDSPRFQIHRSYKAPAPFQLGSTFRGYAGYDSNGLPIIVTGFELDDLDDVQRRYRDKPLKNLAATENVLQKAEARTIALLNNAQIKAELVREKMVADVRQVELLNAQAEMINQRVEAVLRTVLGAPETLNANDENAWNNWYYERIGYRYTPPRKVFAVDGIVSLPTPYFTSCFAAGTPIHTRQGVRPIESIRVGDQLLSRDTTTGALAFQPVLAVHHNPPDKALKIALENGDSVVASLFHRFWRAGKGWAMARDLKTGDVLRTLDGPSRITSIEEAPVQPVHNFDVAEFRTYFVGRTAMLVHDNRLPEAHATAPPFDLGANDGPAPASGH